MEWVDANGAGRGVRSLYMHYDELGNQLVGDVAAVTNLIAALASVKTATDNGLNTLTSQNKLVF